MKSHFQMVVQFMKNNRHFSRVEIGGNKEPSWRSRFKSTFEFRIRDVPFLAPGGKLQ